MQLADVLEFFRGRMAQAYTEQIWAVTLVGSMNAFVILNGKKLETIRTRLLSWGVGGGAVLALLFIWSRQGIYRYYDSLAKGLIKGQFPVALPDPTGILGLASRAVGWSGALLYSLVVVGMTWASLRVLRKNRKAA